MESFIEEREIDVFYPLAIHTFDTSSCLEVPHHSYSHSRGCLLCTLKMSVYGEASKSAYIPGTLQSMLPIRALVHDLGESEEPSF